eukprot:364252-Chlamydomonas_euryale.AAC.7
MAEDQDRFMDRLFSPPGGGKPKALYTVGTAEYGMWVCARGCSLLGRPGLLVRHKREAVGRCARAKLPQECGAGTEKWLHECGAGTEKWLHGCGAGTAKWPQERGAGTAKWPQERGAGTAKWLHERGAGTEKWPQECGAGTAKWPQECGAGTAKWPQERAAATRWDSDVHERCKQVGAQTQNWKEG